jgi:kynurenine 3-monooxygenase
MSAPRRVDLKDNIVIVGSGLVGCLLGIYLRKLSYPVTIFESRADPRLVADKGRSINLVITSRGIAALTSVSDELASKIMAITTPVFGRTLHPVGGGSTQYQPYGPDSSYCNFSVSRLELNTVLLSAAEEAGCRVHFSHPLVHIDVAQRVLYFYLQEPGTGQLYQKAVHCGHIFASDGGGSRSRQALKGFLGDQCSDVQQPLRYGYKELTMPAPTRTQRVDTESLHIWPRGSHFMMALPNKDRSFTVTLYMNETGPLSFSSLNTAEKVREYFAEHYPDAIALMPHFVDEYMRNPVGFLGTVFCSPWVYKDHIALIGDAAHAITPFFGQGCNCGFEDVLQLYEIMKDHKRSGSLEEVFRRYGEARKPNGDAIGLMALDNFVEMMSKTADKRFLLEKEIEMELSRRFPSLYASRYVLVTHSLVPYSLCRQIGFIQDGILSQLSQGAASLSDVNFQRAAELIQSELAPFLQKHNISSKDFNYVSKYYPKPNQARL